MNLLQVGTPLSGGERKGSGEQSFLRTIQQVLYCSRAPQPAACGCATGVEGGTKHDCSQ